ncbi:MAG: hypothetical protein ACRD22_19295 [Terriglobia bacterium]
MKPFAPQVVTGIGISKIIPTDHYQAPFNLSLAVDISATATYNVEYTLDDISSGQAPATWYSVPNFGALSAAKQGQLTQPCTAVRLNVTASTGTATLRGMQSGL